MHRQPREGTTLLEYDRQLLQGAPLLDGQLVSMDAAASTATQQVRHGLGRVYRGGIVVLQDVGTASVRFLPPEGQADPATYLYFALSAANAVTFKAWAF
jgi:hypothetical protein